MAEDNNYIKSLKEALNTREEWLEKSELPKLKEELRAFHTGFASLYNLYVKKRLINEDPYKQETKISELEIPNTAAFSDAERLDQLTRRLANFDNQLDFLVNFYQFSVRFLNLNRIKLILGLVKYIDWTSLTPDSQSPLTRAVAEMTSQIKMGTDSLTMGLIAKSLSHLNKSYAPIMGYLKALTEYQKESYKLDLRDITTVMSQEEVSNIASFKKKFNQIRKGVPFYPDLVDEVIKEDYSSDGQDLKTVILKKLQIPGSKPSVDKAQISFKGILVDGIYGLGSAAQTLVEIAGKMDICQEVLQSKKQSFIEKLKKLLRQAFNKEPETIFYDLEYMDPVKSIPVKEKVN